MKFSLLGKFIDIKAFNHVVDVEDPCNEKSFRPYKKKIAFETQEIFWLFLAKCFQWGEQWRKMVQRAVKYQKQKRSGSALRLPGCANADMSYISDSPLDGVRVAWGAPLIAAFSGGRAATEKRIQFYSNFCSSIILLSFPSYIFLCCWGTAVFHVGMKVTHEKQV